MISAGVSGQLSCNKLFDKKKRSVWCVVVLIHQRTYLQPLTFWRGCIYSDRMHMLSNEEDNWGPYGKRYRGGNFGHLQYEGQATRKTACARSL